MSWAATNGSPSANIRWHARSTVRCISRAAARRTAIAAAGAASGAAAGGTNGTSAAAMDRFRYDPEDPVPSLGGNNCCGTPTPAGPMDQRPIEGRRDILIYTSDYLDEEVEV